MPKMRSNSVWLVLSDMDKTPLSWLQEHPGYCYGAADIVEAFTDLREMGHRFQGVWKVTIEKANPKAVKVWRRVSKMSGGETDGS